MCDDVCALMCSLVLLLGIFLYTRWRSYKGLKEGVYHVSAHHDGWEDIRENVLNYDEEGGGEEDQVRPNTLAKLSPIFHYGATGPLLSHKYPASTVTMSPQQLASCCSLLLLYHHIL